jgi:preprotein translocase subunit SecD
LKNLSWKPILVLVVIIAGFIYILPSIDMIINNRKEPSIWPYKKINLGLDLQGGMHLVLEVDSAKAVESTVERIAHDLRVQLRKEKIPAAGINREGLRIRVGFKQLADRDRFNKDLLEKEFKDLEVEYQESAGGLYQAILGLPEKEREHIKKMAVEQALETIRNRIDQFGVSEPDIRRQGEKRILIQLPGIRDTQRAKDLIGKTALLEFKMVDDRNDVESALKGTVPKGREILYQIRRDKESGREIKIPYLIKKRTLLTGAHLVEARVQYDRYNQPYVGIKFDRKGGRIFARITGDNVNKHLAIVLDNKVYSAPRIDEKIPGGEARITGSFTTDEATDLAIVLRAGALPAPVNILEERTVGPSLGTDSINKGLISMCIGGIIVLLFMIIYYKASGIIADFALIINIVLIGGCLAGFPIKATLTLPGIAGIILTIGMAVDANVLIFERIREELSLGKTPRGAVDAGYERATLTILDANVTTLIAAIVLFQFGTGAIRGFAVTLSLGVISSMFTALIMTRLIFDYLLTKRKIRRLSI